MLLRDREICRLSTQQTANKHTTQAPASSPQAIQEQFFYLARQIYFGRNNIFQVRTVEAMDTPKTRTKDRCAAAQDFFVRSQFQHSSYKNMVFHNLAVSSFQEVNNMQRHIEPKAVPLAASFGLKQNRAIHRQIQ